MNNIFAKVQDAHDILALWSPFTLSVLAEIRVLDCLIEVFDKHFRSILLLYSPLWHFKWGDKVQIGCRRRQEIFRKSFGNCDSLIGNFCEVVGGVEVGDDYGVYLLQVKHSLRILGEWFGLGILSESFENCCEFSGISETNMCWPTKLLNQKQMKNPTKRYSQLTY